MQRDLVIAVLCSILAGLAVTAQTVLNSRLSAKIGLAQCMTIVSVITLVLSIAAWAVAPRWSQQPSSSSAHWLEYAGGVFGFAIIVGLTVAAPRIGIGRALAIAILAQLLLAMLFDRLGLAGVQRAITTPQVLGVLLMVGGAYLVLRR